MSRDVKEKMPIEIGCRHPKPSWRANAGHPPLPAGDRSYCIGTDSVLTRSVSVSFLYSMGGMQRKIFTTKDSKRRRECTKCPKKNFVHP